MSIPIELTSISPIVEEKQSVDEGKQELIQFWQTHTKTNIRNHIMSLVKVGMMQRNFQIKFIDDITGCYKLLPSNFPKFWTLKITDAEEPYVWKGILITSGYVKHLIDEVNKLGLAWYINQDKYGVNSFWIDCYQLTKQ